MTLHVYEDLQQGTSEWLSARCGLVTASTVGQLITPRTVKPAANDTSRGLAMIITAERITGHVEPIHENDDMRRGSMAEPFARDIYSENYSWAREVGFMTRDFGGYKIGYSPDGLVDDNGLIEIKAPRQKKHLATILADEVPLDNLAQCQAGLLVSGREWLDFISYNSGMPLFVKRVEPDPKWFAAIKDAVTAFEEASAQMLNNYLTAIEGRPLTERIDFFPDMELNF